MLDTTRWRTDRFYKQLPCAQCGKTLIAPTWSEHVSDRCVRHVWSCEACGYEFETSVYLRTAA
jgi:transcription elongation factor Elf1